MYGTSLLFCASYVIMIVSSSGVYRFSRQSEDFRAMEFRFVLSRNRFGKSADELEAQCKAETERIEALEEEYLPNKRLVCAYVTFDKEETVLAAITAL